MINFRIIARIYGLMLIFEGIMMLAAAGISYFLKDSAASSLLFSGLITITAGVFVYTPVKGEEQLYGNREGFLIITGTFLIYIITGMLPYLLSGTIKNITDAFFESASGFTTTGATILKSIDSLPRGIVLWRSLTQWIGGLGIIFLSLYVLPVFKDNIIQLSTTDFSGQPQDKIYPRWVDTAKRLISLYIILTILEALFLAAGGMNPFDAACISLSTLSTGGFSPHNYSLTLLTAPYAKIVITIFMFLGGTNMAIIYYLYKRNLQKIKENREFIYYLVLSLAFCLVVSGLLMVQKHPFSESVINGSFHVISIITTTGFYTNDYTQWGNFILLLLFILMFTGGTVGSASGGIKIARLMTLGINTRMEIKRLIHPDAYLPVRINRKIIPQEIVYNILVFVTIYFIIICSSAFIFSMMNYDIITSFSTAASILANIGPAIGEFGPLTTYSSLPVAGKWFISFLMILGRLEMLAVMVLFARSFFRK